MTERLLKPPKYRDGLTTGIMHFGPGAFHRAHQAEYLHRLLDDDPRWGVAAVSMRSGNVIDALRSQDGLYTLAILDAQLSFTTIGVHTRLFTPSQGMAVRSQLLDPGVRIVTTTVTEKGYCLQGDGTLDFAHPDISHDLAHRHDPVSLVGWLALGLSDRRAQGLPPFAAICCDNMSSNGARLRDAIIAFAGRLDPELAQWIAGEARFPETMVDSITPATSDRLRTIVRDATGFDDSVPVSREAYAQWVIEDVLPPGSPDLAGVGVDLTNDVEAWERAKLRILNGTHSTLAYTGLLLGHSTVAEAMADKDLSAFAERLICDDVIPALGPSPIDLRAYARATLARFRNPAINHSLTQIAADGSQKLPYRLFATISEAVRDGRDLDRLAIPIAAWILFVEHQTRSGGELVDPRAAALKQAAASSDVVESILYLNDVFPSRLSQNDRFKEAVRRSVVTLRKDCRAAIAQG